VTASSEPAIARAGEDDLQALQALVEAAGWNQVAADWRLFLELGQVWCVRDDAGRAIASAALLPYPPATAWISMVLTAPEARSQGHGTRLFAHALRAAEALGLAPQLDATPAGQPIYEAAGFRPLFALTRWRRGGTAPTAMPGLSVDRDEAETWDRRALGFARPAIIGALLERGPASLAPDGMILSRDGRKALQLGPLVAYDSAKALRLLDEQLAQIGPEIEIVVDAVDEYGTLAARLAEAGFAPERPFTRMAKGAVPIGDRALLYAIAGPELG
jgi:GNAT superfamily N-acetyltransferase